MPSMASAWPWVTRRASMLLTPNFGSVCKAACANNISRYQWLHRITAFTLQFTLHALHTLPRSSLPGGESFLHPPSHGEPVNDVSGTDAAFVESSKTAVPDSHHEGCIAQAATRSNVDSWKLDSDMLPRTVRLGVHFPGLLATCIPHL